MFLKRIEIQGFKSFADKTRLNFREILLYLLNVKK